MNLDQRIVTLRRYGLVHNYSIWRLTPATTELIAVFAIYRCERCVVLY